MTTEEQRYYDWLNGGANTDPLVRASRELPGATERERAAKVYQVWLIREAERRVKERGA